MRWPWRTRRARRSSRRDIETSFPGVLALRQAHFDLREGEVHALMGETGAGTSTPMTILAGVCKPDAGQIL